MVRASCKTYPLVQERTYRGVKEQSRMKLKDVPVGATAHICSMFFVGDFKVLEQEEGSTKCVQINGASAKEMEYLRRGELPPKSDRTYHLWSELDASIVE